MAIRTQPACIALAVSLAGIGLNGCRDGNSAARDSAASGGKLRVLVSVAPQADFVRRVGGEHVQVDVLVGEGQDPHRFSPTPSQMAVLGEARLMFTVGMPFEERLKTKVATANSALKFVDTGAGFERLALECEHPSHAGDGHPEEGEGHDEHEGHEGHAEHEPDPHIWLAPNLIKVQAAHIESALAAARPEHAAEFSANRAAFDSELDALHAELSKMMEPHIGEKFFVFHPAFGYFGHTYGIEQVALQIGGNNPTPKELAAFIAHAKEEGVRVLFVQPQFDSRSAETVAAALGAKVVALDPLAVDVLPNLRRIAQAIGEAFGG